MKAGEKGTIFNFGERAGYFLCALCGISLRALRLRALKLLTSKAAKKSRNVREKSRVPGKCRLSVKLARF
jgi:hypothetical protein